MRGGRRIFIGLRLLCNGRRTAGKYLIGRNLLIELVLTGCRMAAQSRGASKSVACKSCKTCNAVVINLCEDEDDAEDLDKLGMGANKDEASDGTEDTEMMTIAEDNVH